MSTTKIPLPQLVVIPDPEHKGKHPYHDARFIGTADVTWDDSQQYTESGSLVAKLTDCPRQAEYAAAFAAAPDLLYALIEARDLLRLAEHHISSGNRGCLGEQARYHRVMRQSAVAIAKATETK